MKSAVLSIALTLAMGVPAFAGTKPSAPPPACVKLADLKAQIRDAKFTPLNIAQFHFMLGAYAAVPPVGLPGDTDNAFLVQSKDKSAVFWMKAECASKTPPMLIGDKFVAIIKSIAPVAGENSDAPDDHKGELSL